MMRPERWRARAGWILMALLASGAAGREARADEAGSTRNQELLQPSESSKTQKKLIQLQPKPGSWGAPEPAPPPSKPLSSDHQKELDSGSSLRTAGMITTGVGALLLVYSAGAIFLTRQDGAAGAAAGAAELIGIGASLPFFAVGVPLWRAGQRRMDHALGYVPLDLTAVIVPTNGGALAGIRVVSF